MLQYVEIFVLAIFLSAVLVPVACRLAPKLGAVDMPHALGVHSQPTPRIGGVAIFLAFLAATVAALCGLVPLSKPQDTQILGVLFGAGILMIVGLLDDMRRIAPEVKFAWEILGAMVAVFYGIQIGITPLLAVSLPLTLLYLVGGANAINLFDGMDGLAAGTGAVIAFFLIALAVLQGNLLVLVLCVPLLGALLGFLPYNLHTARIFMGDSGSLHVGFLLAIAAALLSNRSFEWVWFLAPLVVLGLPLLDTAGALVRRRRARIDMFGGDRRHLYDLVMSRGVSYRKTVVALWGISAGMGLAGLASAGLAAPLAWIIFATVPLLALTITMRLGLFANGERKPDSTRPLEARSSARLGSGGLPAAVDFQESAS